MTEKELRREFSMYGPIENVSLVRTQVSISSARDFNDLDMKFGDLDPLLALCSTVLVCTLLI